MSDKALSGKWTGEFMYGNLYPAELRGKAVTFELDITVENGQFSGFATDEETDAHFNRPATVSGFIEDNLISFIKKYPHYYETNPNDPEKMIFYPEVASHEIHYEGRYVNGVFTGDWEIISSYKDEWGNIHEDGGNGSWSMQKE